MCSCVLFLVRFSRVFCRAFSGVFWWFCWWYFLCFSWCFFHCVLVLFSVLFFVLVPFLFYIRFPLVVVLFFAVLFFVVFGCFFRAFFRAFCGVFFVSFIVHFFRSFSRFFFRVFFFRALGGTRDKRPQYFAFWPVLFSVLFLVVTTSEDRIYTTYSNKKSEQFLWLILLGGSCQYLELMLLQLPTGALPNLMNCHVPQGKSQKEGGGVEAKIWKWHEWWNDLIEMCQCC